MPKDTTAVKTALQEATKGLTFQSEADYPVEPFVLGKTSDKPVTPEVVLQAMGHDPSTPVKAVSLTRFFQSATKEQEWHNDQERETVRRFQTLVKTLKEDLSDIKVFQVGKIESDVYVVGKTASGDLAGVKTKVVET